MNIKCLDHGFIELVDHMGTDAAVVQAARVSYSQDKAEDIVRQVNIGEDRLTDKSVKLIRYLFRHRHTTPFEMCEVKFCVQAPIFVFRQWHRHRTASINEVSARYTELKDEFYLPENFCTQSDKNKQGASEPIADDINSELKVQYHNQYYENYALYQGATAKAVSREQARISLPVATYSRMYWMANLHNIFHFLALRMDSHAQYEIRVYAEAMGEIISKLFPVCWQAFLDYRFNALTLSAQEIRELGAMIRVDKDYVTSLQGRELQEFRDKIDIILNAK